MGLVPRLCGLPVYAPSVPPTLRTFFTTITGWQGGQRHSSFVVRFVPLVKYNQGQKKACLYKGKDRPQCTVPAGQPDPVL